MKKIALFALIVFTIFSAQAQLTETTGKNIEVNNIQAIPVKNGKVTFEETIPAQGYTAEQVKSVIDAWLKERFVKPTIISAKHINSGNPYTAILKGEEYIVFKNKPLVLERARIYYYLTLTANDGSCTFNMSRITYWYDDEDENGGLKMIAEEWITDENAINKKGNLKKFEGKFRNKTIELKDILVNDLTNRLNRK
jgi:colicin import membrane protein